MTNQFNSPKAVAAKERTTQALAAETANQSIIKSSEAVAAIMKQQLYKSQTRRSELALILDAFAKEDEDERATIACLEAGLTVLEEYPQKQGAL